jgi:16S rRNA (cytidine1402-2'-O)-methyltransferase
MNAVDGGGALVLVATPIGNLGDIGVDALEHLRAADVVAAEDTRRTRRLLSAFDIRPRRLVSIRAENEAKAIEQVTAWLDSGLQVALVSDAGMPALSDPGERLVHGVLDADGRVRVVAGPDAATTALLASGLPRQRWCFEGFLPRDGRRRTDRLAHLAVEARTTVVFEAPHRLHRTIDDLDDRLGPERSIAVCNDLTKRYERVWRGTVRSVRAALEDVTPRGEFVLVIGPRERSG